MCKNDINCGNGLKKIEITIFQTESSEGSKVQDQTKIQKVFVITSSGEKKDITLPIASGSPVKSLRPTVAASSKKGKASEEDKALRKYACKVCDSKFKEVLHFCTCIEKDMILKCNRGFSAISLNNNKTMICFILLQEKY
ncbi:hypothetical protein DPMN_026858 [Dreissena polymorpha]|uniref:Uncharacterized protein n=1 Tax=Dreissena polymorpha TaxID=45954 RepID=A0A9D4LS24_DREPO|nr:hypothetical protein DPMN_026858 [Dreissena polymorpha]